MCHTKKQVFTVCAHTCVVVVECPNVAFARDKSNRWACVRPPCQHTQAIEPVYGFCPTCASFYVPGPSPLRSEKVVSSYWTYKATRKWQKAVDASLVPGRVVFGEDVREERNEEDGAALPSSRPSLSRWQQRRSSSCVSGQTCEELAMVHAIGWEGEFSETCRLCRTAKRRDTTRWARRAREATLDWAKTGDAHVLPREQCVATTPKWSSPAPSPSRDRLSGRLPTPAPSSSSISRRSSNIIERVERDIQAQISAFPPSPRTSRDSSERRANRKVDGQGSIRSQFSFPELVPSPLRATSLAQAKISEPKPETIQRPHLEIRRFAPPRGPRLAKCRIHGHHGDASAPDCSDCTGGEGDGRGRILLNEVAIPPAWI